MLLCLQGIDDLECSSGEARQFARVDLIWGGIVHILPVMILARKRQGDPVAYRGRHCGLGVQRWSDAEVPCLRLVLRLCLRLVAYSWLRR